MACFKSFWEGFFIASFPEKYKSGLFRSLYFNCKVDVNISWKSKHLVGRGGNRGWNVGWFWKACRDNSNDLERKALFIAEGSGKAVSPFPWLDKGTGPPFQSILYIKRPKSIQIVLQKFQSILCPPCTVRNPLTSFLPLRGGLVSGSRIDGATVPAIVQPLQPSFARQSAVRGAAPDGVEDVEPGRPRVHRRERHAAHFREGDGSTVVYTMMGPAPATTPQSTT